MLAQKDPDAIVLFTDVDEPSADKEHHVNSKICSSEFYSFTATTLTHINHVIQSYHIKLRVLFPSDTKKLFFSGVLYLNELQPSRVLFDVNIVFSFFKILRSRALHFQ